ncbi:hypothetical protein PENTCL1PPCAC_663, partial [Pristionchus entomophagus]
ICQIAEATTCYTANVTSKPYDILNTVTVETRRGCEVLCDADSTCAGFSFKDARFESSCVLLSISIKNQICSAPQSIFLKQTTGCADRTNITAEFGVDPCIDERVDSAFRGFYTKPICTQGKGFII